jgi:hypothetical protein
LSNKFYNNEINKTSDQQTEKEEQQQPVNKNEELIRELSLSEKAKTLGVVRIAREYNTILIEIQKMAKAKKKKVMLTHL